MFDARDRSGITGHLDSAREQIDLGGLGLIDVVAAVIHRVDEGLAESPHRVADPASYLASILLLLEMERREILQVVEAIAKLIHQPAAERALFLHIPGPIRGELHDFDPGPTKPLRRIMRKKTAD